MKLHDRRVVIIGGGPSGLSAAIELRRRGVRHVTLYEREQQAGGVPRHTNHLGFGMRDLHRMMTGPRYARTLTEHAARIGVEMRMGTPIFSLDDIDADAVILATGVRERPRSARLVPGDRPAGIFTTGSLQQFAMAGRHVGTRAVIVGAEHVSFSAIITLAHVDCRAVAMVTALPRHQSYEVLRLATATVRRVPVMTDVDVAEIVGRRRVEQVVLTNGRRIECDTVIFTGDWIPDNELARRSGLQMQPRLKGPLVDDAFRTSRESVFAIGNLVHKVAAADRCALDGKAVVNEILKGYRDAN
ncbi:MAG TPA: NAD(P)/FAD-dependent oxidoreductase [Ilumatobacteraceae bacterium]|nr:NAD(P)/FAD-dependent oxidoreductase [Ilumatobacteraceae bacterium]